MGSGTQTHEAPGNLHIRDVIVICPKLALGQLVQIQVMDSASDKILKFYIYITNPQVYGIINWLNKNLKIIFLYIFIRRLGLILKLGQKQLAIPLFNFDK